MNTHPSKARNNSLLLNFTNEEALKITEKGARFPLKFKRVLWEASNKKCAYCGEEIQHHKIMHVDHFIPVSKEGKNEISNFICACHLCNISKNNVDMTEFRMRMSINKSALKGILRPTQVRQLLEIGVILPFEIQEFHFEKINRGGF